MVLIHISIGTGTGIPNSIGRQDKKIYFKAGKTMQANTNESISAHTLPVNIF